MHPRKNDGQQVVVKRDAWLRRLLRPACRDRALQRIHKLKSHGPVSKSNQSWLGACASCNMRLHYTVLCTELPLLKPAEGDKGTLHPRVRMQRGWLKSEPRMLNGIWSPQALQYDSMMSKSIRSSEMGPFSTFSSHRMAGPRPR